MSNIALLAQDGLSGASTAVVCGYFWDVVLLLAGSGAFGGLLAVCSLLDIRAILHIGSSSLPALTCREIFWALVLGLIGGAGGALAFGAVLAVDGKFDTRPSEKLKLVVLSTGITAGFAGFRLLKLLGSRLDEQIVAMERQTQSKLDEQRKQVDGEIVRMGKQVAEARTQMAQFAEALNYASIALNKVKTGKRIDELLREAVLKLEAVRKWCSSDRQVGMLLGRLLRHQGKVDDAIRVLSEVVDARKREGLIDDDDMADLLYNRACYWNLRARAPAHTEEQQTLRAEAWADLKESCSLSPSNLDEATADEDLTDLPQQLKMSFDDLRKR